MYQAMIDSDWYWTVYLPGIVQFKNDRTLKLNY